MDADTVPEIDVTDFAAAHARGAYVIDVREPMEYVSGHVPGAVLVPMADVPPRLGELPRRETVYVICASGHRSYTVAGWLRQVGVDAVSVAGGTTGWEFEGRPVVYGMGAGDRFSDPERGA